MEKRGRSAFWILAALVPVVLLLIGIARLAVNIPYWDDWRWADMVIKLDTHQLTFADVWHPEVEHRLFFATLVALTLSRFGGYSTIVESYFSWAFSLAGLACLYYLARKTLNAKAWGPVLFVQSVLLFSLAQLTTYLWGYQLAWSMVDALALLTLALLTSVKLGFARFSSALASAIVAALSSAQGLLVLPLGLAVLVAQRPRPNRFLFFWAIASVLTIAIYVPGIQPHLRAENLTLEDQVVRFLVWPIVLGAPIAGWSGVAGAFLAGLAALVFTTATGVFYARLVVAKSPEVARWTAWLGLTLFGIAGSFLIAFGRGSLGATYGLQERYITLASMAWLGLVPLIALHLERIRDYVPRARRILILVTCGVLVLSLAREYVSTIPPTLVARERRLSQLELMLHYRTASDAELISKLFPNESALALMRALNSPSPDNVRTMIEGLEAHREGPFRPR